MKKLVLVLVFIFITSCGHFNDNKGSIGLTIEWPKRNFKIKEIPANTEKISIKISGEGLSSPINDIILRKNSENRVTQKYTLPIGEKQVTVEALDNKDNILAKALASTFIEANKLKTLEIELKTVKNNIPSIQIDTENSKLPVIDIVVEEKNSPPITVPVLTPKPNFTLLPTITPSIPNPISTILPIDCKLLVFTLRWGQIPYNEAIQVASLWEGKLSVTNAKIKFVYGLKFSIYDSLNVSPDSTFVKWKSITKSGYNGIVGIIITSSDSNDSQVSIETGYGKKTFNLKDFVNYTYIKTIDELGNKIYIKTIKSPFIQDPCRFNNYEKENININDIPVEIRNLILTVISPQELLYTLEKESPDEVSKFPVSPEPELDNLSEELNNIDSFILNKN